MSTLSQINLNGTDYEIEDAYAREQLENISGGSEKEDSVATKISDWFTAHPSANNHYLSELTSGNIPAWAFEFTSVTAGTYVPYSATKLALFVGATETTDNTSYAYIIYDSGKILTFDETGNEFQNIATVNINEFVTNTDLQNALSGITGVRFEVVSTLPTENISTSTIYLVANSSDESENGYDEYIYIDEDGTLKWEKVGSVGGSIDLSGYATTTELNTGLAGKINKPSGVANNKIAVTDSEESDHIKWVDYDTVEYANAFPAPSVAGAFKIDMDDAQAVIIYNLVSGLTIYVGSAMMEFTPEVPLGVRLFNNTSLYLEYNGGVIAKADVDESDSHENVPIEFVNPVILTDSNLGTLTLSGTGTITQWVYTETQSATKYSTGYIKYGNDYYTLPGDIPSKTSDLVNDSDFVNSTQLATGLAGKVALPSVAGTEGQVLALDNSLAPVWKTVESGGESSGSICNTRTTYVWDPTVISEQNMSNSTLYPNVDFVVKDALSTSDTITSPLGNIRACKGKFAYSTNTNNNGFICYLYESSIDNVTFLNLLRYQYNSTLGKYCFFNENRSTSITFTDVNYNLLSKPIIISDSYGNKYVLIIPKTKPTGDSKLAKIGLERIGYDQPQYINTNINYTNQLDVRDCAQNDNTIVISTNLGILTSNDYGVTFSWVPYTQFNVPTEWQNKISFGFAYSKSVEYFNGYWYMSAHSTKDGSYNDYNLCIVRTKDSSFTNWEVLNFRDLIGLSAYSPSKKESMGLFVNNDIMIAMWEWDKGVYTLDGKTWKSCNGIVGELSSSGCTELAYIGSGLFIWRKKNTNVTDIYSYVFDRDNNLKCIKVGSFNSAIQKSSMSFSPKVSFNDILYNGKIYSLPVGDDYSTIVDTIGINIIDLKMYQDETSSTGTEYTAGDGITITDDEISVTDPIPAHTSSDSGKVLNVESDGTLAWAEVSGVLKVNAIPDLPDTDGTYTLQVTIHNGTPTYEWVSQE